ncbi:hypothetical protein [Mannheimia granulomatis]|uniref:hypothetical protein n=1 Tax=Mannheimia granulomatis TaxID=85402 RepID=UPI000AE28744|nr:hypothetical protein [Mannheimia granulomatis]
MLLGGNISYTRLIYHIVFRTKYGTPTISEQHETSLYRYINGYVSSIIVTDSGSAAIGYCY